MNTREDSGGTKSLVASLESKSALKTKSPNTVSYMASYLLFMLFLFARLLKVVAKFEDNHGDKLVVFQQYSSYLQRVLVSSYCVCNCPRMNPLFST